MSIFKRGDSYWFKFKFNGQDIRRPTKSKNKRVAEDIERAYKTALVKSGVPC